MANTISYDDPIFASFNNIAGFDLRHQIDLINSSPLLVDLLTEFKARSGTLTYNTTDGVNAYIIDSKPPVIELGDVIKSGNNFTRILSHELGHAYDQLFKHTITRSDDDFSTIISTERDESEATAISFIISRQIKTNSLNHVDIGISNRVYLVDPGIQNKLESKYGAAIDAIGNDTQALWSMATRMADDIWGLNFSLRPQGGASRWQKLLDNTFVERDDQGNITSDDTPDFLQSSVRTFQSARINDNGQYEFIFTEQQGANAGQEIHYIYGANTGTTGPDLLVVGENDHHLQGGGGNDVLVGNWTRLGEEDDTGDVLEGGAGNDTLIGGTGSDTLIGGSGNDTFIIHGTDEDPEAFDTFNGGDGADTIQGGDQDDTIRVHDFTGDNRVEIINGGGGENILAGTGQDDTIDLSETELRNIDRIETGGGNDIIRLSYDSLAHLDGTTLDGGGGGRDVIQGGSEDDLLDLSAVDIRNIEVVNLMEGDDFVFVSESADGPEEYLGGTGNDYLVGDGEGRGLQLDGGEGQDTISGGDFDDVLKGGFDEDQDTMEGGEGYDQYLADNNDIIEDSDGRGMVYFGSWSDGTILSYGYKKEGSDVYEGNGGEYRLSGGTLTFTSGGRTVTIRGYDKEAASLGIRLEEEPPDDPQAPQDFSSPLALDLNNNQQTSTSLYATDVHFDMDGDGFAERVGWIESGDGLLSLDVNQNGAIDTGAELFGNYTPDENGNYAADGFQALARYDDNQDHVINSDDEIFSSLTVWTDNNSDGISQADELHTLSSLDITSISLTSDGADGFEAHNRTKGDATFTRTTTDAGGNATSEDLLVRDVWFQRDNRDTTYNFDGSISPDIAALPDMKGTGRVHNLSHAMADDAELQQLTQSLLSSASDDLATLYERADALLARWTHSDDIDPNQARGQQYVLNHYYANPRRIRVYRTYAHARDVAVLEAFNGKLFSMNVDGEQTSDVIGTAMARQVNDNYEELRSGVVINLLAQNLLGDDVYDTASGELNRELVYERLEPVLNSPDDTLRGQGSSLLAALLDRDGLSVFDHLDAAVLQNPDVTADLTRSGITLNLDTEGRVSGTIGRHRYGSDGADTLSGADVYGLSGDDHLSGTSGHDTIFGGAGNDVINGYAGDDMLYGGAGDDELHAGDGRAYGHDILIGGFGDDLLYGSGRATSYRYHYGDGNDIIIDPGDVGNTPDVLELRGIRREDLFITADGRDLVLQIRDIGSPNAGTYSGSIRITNGFNGRGAIERYEFEDGVLDYTQLLEISNVYDTTHTYTLDQGRVTIHDTGGSDTLVFGEGIGPADLVVQAGAGNDDLLIGIREEGVAFADLAHVVTIQSGFTTQDAIETFVFNDGATLDLNGLLALQAGTPGDDTLRFLGNTDDSVNGLAGNDTIITGPGDDQLAGGTGDDTLKGGAGDDVYIFNRGDGHDLVIDQPEDGSGGHDTLALGDGIAPGDLVVIGQGDDLVIGLAETGVDFADLADTVTLRSWRNRDSRVEQIRFSDGTTWSSSDILSAMTGSGIVHGLDGDDIIEGNDEDNIIFGAGGNDRVTGRGGNDTLYGESGDDILAGNGGKDVLDGGTGNDQLAGGADNDSLYGGTGDDHYIFNRGDGHDVIVDGAPGSSASNGSDALAFGAGIDPADLVARQQGNDLVIGLAETGVDFADLADTVVIRNWYAANNRIESFQFAGGETLSAGELVQFIRADDGGEIMGIETDTVFGNSPTDNGYHGLAGNDTYHFAPGDGRDTVLDAGGTDRLVFADGIAPADLRITWQQGTKDIVITFADNSDDQLTLRNWYHDQGRIETIEFADGTTWSPADVIDAMGSAGDDVFNGLEGEDNIIQARGGDDIVSTFAGNDTLHGGSGDDGLDAGGGNDTLHGGPGADSLWGGAGDDVYIFNRGDGHDLILDSDTTATDAGSDTLRFGPGIHREDLVFRVDAETSGICA